MYWIFLSISCHEKCWWSINIETLILALQIFLLVWIYWELKINLTLSVILTHSVIMSQPCKSLCSNSGTFHNIFLGIKTTGTIQGDQIPSFCMLPKQFQIKHYNTRNFWTSTQWQHSNNVCFVWVIVIIEKCKSKATRWQNSTNLSFWDINWWEINYSAGLAS